MKKIAAWLLLLFACIPALAWGGDDDWPSSSVFNRRSYFGYRFFVEGGYGMGMNIKTQPFGIGFQPALRYFDAGTTQGFQFGSLFYLGAGVSYLQLVGDAVEAEQPIRQITPYADLRFTFGSVFAAYLDLRPGMSYLLENKSWAFSSSVGFGFDIARSFQLGLELNLLPLNIGTDHTTQMDALVGVHAGLSFGGGCRR